MERETALHLSKLIRKGDSLVLFNETWLPAYEPVSIRIGSGYFHAIVPVHTGKHVLPVDCGAVKAVYRNGVCLWHKDEIILKQKALF